ncbi:MAG: hypothetical protein KGI50_06705 [Patescibacteria group bacterium]|nr:hypothetical protein [Patescibacteria group bacterium]MDE2439265.1 hypothetical protein [Patescibacteria group bacterium]
MKTTTEITKLYGNAEIEKLVSRYNGFTTMQNKKISTSAVLPDSLFLETDVLTVHDILDIESVFPVKFFGAVCLGGRITAHFILNKNIKQNIKLCKNCHETIMECPYGKNCGAAPKHCSGYIHSPKKFHFCYIDMATDFKTATANEED